MIAADHLFIRRLGVDITWPPDMAGIVREVAARRGVRPSELRRTKGRNHAPLRQECWWRIRQLRRPNGSRIFSFTKIATYFDLEDHSTVFHGVRRHAERIGAEP